ncbi:antibiotic biosynthesis monooxygenase [Desulfococcaceae bacterium OttesenSCG-928-F15]|nr:antibiotic biosynthesis monooxygenase [Desulfococcaceae bacterium OttesenSCG-928-F15]
MSIQIVAHIELKPGFREELMPVLKTLVEESRKEEGNIAYDLYENLKKPDKFVMIETWASREAIDAHSKMPHYLDFGKALQNKTERLEINLLKKTL